MAETAEQVQGSCGTEKDDLNLKNAQILQEPPSKLLCKTRMERAMVERAALLRRHF